MDIGDLETLESKTQTILATLEALEREVTQYQQKNASIATAFEKLKDASGEMAEAGRGLSEAADIFRRSDFAEALKAVDARIEQLEESRTAIEGQAGAIEDVAKRVLAGFEQLGADIGSLNEHMPVLLEVREMLVGMAGSIETIEGHSADISSLSQHMPVLLEVRQMLAGMTESMDATTTRIDRIDQNTQKGFGKIKG